MKSDTSQAKPQAQVNIFTVHKVTLIEAIYTHKMALLNKSNFC